MTEAPVSVLERRLRPLRALPGPLRLWVASRLIGHAVPFVGTGGLRVEALERDGVRLALPLRRRVSNHLGSAHAAAVALLAETAGGLAFAFHLPEQRTPVVKHMGIDYLRIARGRLTARAAVPSDALRSLHHDARGEVTVPVDITDETGAGLVTCHMVYAWFTRETKEEAHGDR